MTSAASFKQVLRTSTSVVVGVAAAVAVGAVIIAVTGGPVAASLGGLLEGSVGSTQAIQSTLQNATPLLIVALGTIVALRAGVLNVGQQGQVTMGAAVGAFAVLATGANGVAGLLLGLAAGALGGALWAGIAAALYAALRVQVVISTLLLNFVAIQIGWYAVNRPELLQEQPTNLLGRPNPQSDLIPVGARLTSFELFGVGVGWQTIAVLLAVPVAWLLLSRTPWGVNVRLVGANPPLARRMGVSDIRLQASALVGSGAAAGLAGATILLGASFRFQPGIAGNIGWNGLLVALVAGLSAVLALPSALLFGALHAGGGVLAAEGVEFSVVDIIQALVVLAVLGAFVVAQRRREVAL